MNATAIREQRQTTLPQEVAEAAGLKPGDQVEWRFEAGEIHGRKLQPQDERRLSKAAVRGAIKSSRLTFPRSWEQMRADTREP